MRHAEFELCLCSRLHSASAAQAEDVWNPYTLDLDCLPNLETHRAPFELYGIMTRTSQVVEDSARPCCADGDLLQETLVSLERSRYRHAATIAWYLLAQIGRRRSYLWRKD